MIHIGIDLGGTNLRAAAFDASDTPLELRREAVGDDRTPAALVERVAGLVERLGDNVDGRVAVGVGIAAMLRDRRGTVANSPHLRWRDVPFGELLAARLGQRFRLGVYNDVNAITWGEVVAGAGRGCRDVLAVYVGTGIGSGIVSDGKLVYGASNCAGELGHVKVRWDDDAAPCACGSRGCIEAYVGGSYIDRRIQRELLGRRKSLAAQLAGRIEDVTVRHVDQAAADGDEWALGLWSELAPLLAIAIGNAIAVVNPERLVLGGGVLARTPTLVELVETALTIATPMPLLEPLTVLSAELGDDAGLVGAARLAGAGESIIE